MPSDFASMGSSFRLSERFWSLARRLIPKPARVHPLGGGRPRVPDRRVLAAIFFVLRTGCQWKALDATALGSGSTAHRRFQEWVEAGLFYRLWRVAARRGYIAHIRARGATASRRRNRRKRARHWVVERTHAWLNRCRRLLVR